MKKNKKKILVTGADGLVGHAVRKIVKDYPEYKFIFTTHARSDLKDSEQVRRLFSRIRPDFVLHLAAKVGGIQRNLSHPAEQFTENILMNTHVIHTAYEIGVEKLIAFSSICAFPRNLPIIEEGNLHDGPPHPAHESYAYSKRAVDIQIKAYRKQYNFNGCAVTPSNIFGIHDNFNLEDGHVVPSLIHKCYLAKKNKKPLQVWGNGCALREFLFAEDLAKVCIELFKREGDLPLSLLVSGEREYHIKDIVEKICKVFGHNSVEYDVTKPNGQMRRPSSHVKFREIFPDFKFTDIDEALKTSIEWFIKQYPEVRK